MPASVFNLNHGAVIHISDGPNSCYQYLQMQMRIFYFNIRECEYYFQFCVYYFMTCDVNWRGVFCRLIIYFINKNI